MKLTTIQEIFEEIATKHKAIKSFYTGLATEFNTDYDIEYPAMLIDPVSVTQSVRRGFFQNTWNIVMEVIDDLPDERTMSDVNQVLDSTKEIVNQIISKFVLDYNDTDVTFNNITERADFQIVDNFTVLPLIDDTEKNHTGWQVTFSITEQVKFSSCCNSDVFDA